MCIRDRNKDYIKLARVKGVSSANIMVKHVFKNAFVPLAQYIPASFLYTCLLYTSAWMGDV